MKTTADAESNNAITTDLNKIQKDSWDDFPISCPGCYGIMQPPTLISKTTIFPCMTCKTLLEKPTYMDRSIFYVDSFLYSTSRSVERFMGKKLYRFLPVIVPNGCVGGDAVQAMYKNKAYNTIVPEGLKTGDLFKVRIDVTDDPPRKCFTARTAEIGNGYELEEFTKARQLSLVKNDSVEEEVVDTIPKVDVKKEDKVEKISPSLTETVDKIKTEKTESNNIEKS